MNHEERQNARKSFLAGIVSNVVDMNGRDVVVEETVSGEAYGMAVKLEVRFTVVKVLPWNRKGTPQLGGQGQ